MQACSRCGRESEKGFAYCPSCGAQLADLREPLEHRKTVTILFCDVAGSTALGESLDAEAFRSLLARYFEQMKAIVDRHEGTVEKFVGDAVMAVFGVPAAHEDDAFRAAHAAIEMREAMPALGVAARIGVNTGEVVSGTEERLATGDAVNVAARLEQAAQPGDVLMGAATVALLGTAAEVEPVGPLTVRGKAEPLVAYRLIAMRPVPERHRGALFVGRERELATLREVWARVEAERRCELVTIVGEAGIGKSRLVDEALASMDATVARGRCLPYGQGITYWPVVEVLTQLDRRPSDEAVAAPIRSLLGEDRTSSAEEIAWAFRKTAEAAAAERPLSVVFDDLQWGEETFLQLIEHVALLSSGAPILLLCMARPEFSERRPAWPVSIRLEPLADADVVRLLPDALDGRLRDRITRAAGGNPLFVDEMVAMAVAADGDIVVPPTLRALLAARLDQLEPAERNVLELGAIEGEIFHRGAVRALSPPDGQVTPRLTALVRKGLIRPHPAQLPGDDAFRFRHLLLRDAAYDALPKATRAELHERFAAWLETSGKALVELDEILGHHLEQAVRYQRELGWPPDEALAEGALDRLASAGRRALARMDDVAAAGLLERAAALMPAAVVDIPLEFDLVDALWGGGRSEDALRRSRSIVARAAAVGDRVAESCARVRECELRIGLEPEGAAEELAALVAEALPVFEGAGDDVALCVAYRALGQVANMRAQFDTLMEAYERADAHGARAGQSARYVGWRALGRLYGTTPVSRFLAWREELDEQDRRNWIVRVTRAWATAMLGGFGEARVMIAELRAELAERGGGVALVLISGQEAVEVELLAGDPGAAAALAEGSCRLLDELGLRGVLSTVAGRLAQACYQLDRLEQADAWAGRALAEGASDDALTQMLWRQARAKVLARRGRHAEAEAMAREAVRIGARTEMLNAQADADADLAEVLWLAGRPEDAAQALEGALARYQRKENLVMAERMRVRLTQWRGR